MSAVDFAPVTIVDATPLSALLNVQQFAMNALMLDTMTRIGRRGWVDQYDDIGNASLDPSPLAGGGFRFRTGMTTMTIVVYGSLVHTFRVFFNGTQVHTLTLNGTNQTTTITLTGRGFTDGQIIEVYFDVDRSSGSAGTYAIRDCYVGPVVMGTSWPGVPTFTTTLSQSSLAQLASAQQWLFDRINLMDRPVFRGCMYRGLHWWTVNRQWVRGSIARSNGANQLTAVIGYRNTNTPAERMRLLIDSGSGYVEVATTPSITAGQMGIYTFSVDLSGYTNEAMLLWKLEQVVTTPWPDDIEGAIATRWNLRWLGTTANSWAYPGLSSYSQTMESLTATTLVTRLNAAASATLTAYNRVTGSADMWDRVRLFRTMPVLDEYQASYYQRELVPRSARWGDGLWVRGKGVKLCWGPVDLKVEKPETPWHDWTCQHEEEIINGEAVQDKYISFDALEGFPVGTFYYLVGADIRYAGEVWS